MRLYPEKLAADLRQRLRPVYLVSGDEQLLVQECADQIRAAARRAGCSERVVLDTGERRFDWLELAQGAGSLSLFAERRLLELRIPDGKPGAEGSKALLAYLADPLPDDVLLIVAGKIDKASTGSKWYRAIDEAGATISLWPVNAAELPRWLQGRAQNMGLDIEHDAIALLADLVEGNLLAAVQELEKLRLQGHEGRISARQVGDAVGNSARYNLFACIDSALAGDGARGLRMLRGLRAEGTQAPVLLWALLREMRHLQELTAAVAAGSAPAQALSAARVWQTRQPIVQAALQRHSVDSVATLLEAALHVDGCIKGYASGDPWLQLELLLLALAGNGKAPLPLGMPA
jgi:DNA polymerase-3 subunit delta